jgi:hypothetical protein
MERVVRRVVMTLASAVIAAAGGTALARAATPTLPLPANLPANVSLRYVNPFAAAGWQPSRTDMGVDWVPTRPLPVRAIGDALILGSDSEAPWPGKHLIWYQLLGGTHAGDVVYVAENLRRLVRAGRIVRAGQTIATAMPAYPYIETGWADAGGSPRAYGCYKEGEQTNSGKEMARFLRSLGAVTATAAGPGPDAPMGKPC